MIKAPKIRHDGGRSKHPRYQSIVDSGAAEFVASIATRSVAVKSQQDVKHVIIVVVVVVVGIVD